MSNQTKNSDTVTNSSKNSASWDTPYKRSPSKGLTWKKAEQTWENTPETFEEVEQADWSNQDKN